MSKFKKGQSGNPTGRKRGTTNKRTQLGRLLEPHAEHLVNKAVELAMSGDVQALKLCLDRLIPKASSQPIQLEMNEIDFQRIEDLSIIGRTILSSIVNGNISPEDGQKMITIVDSQRKLIEHTDISRKLEEISQLIESKN